MPRQADCFENPGHVEHWKARRNELEQSNQSSDGKNNNHMKGYYAWAIVFNPLPVLAYLPGGSRLKCNLVRRSLHALYRL